MNSMMTGVDRPFLVPVAFVKASALPIELGLAGDDEPAMNEEAGELNDQIMNGGLIEIVRELELETSSEEEEEEMEEMVDDSILGNGNQDTSIDFNQLFVSDTTPSLPSEVLSISTTTSTFVLGLNTPVHDSSMDSDSDSEEIVFVPSRPPIAVIPKSTPIFTAPVALVPAPIVELIPVLESLSASPPDSPTEPIVRPKPLNKNQKRQLKKEGKKARKSGKTHSRSGNQHLFADAPPDSSDEDDTGMEVGDGIELVTGLESKAREGDSDLDWGDAPPPPESAPLRPRATNRKERRKLERAQAQEAARVERLSSGTRHQVAFVLREDLPDREKDVIPLATRSGKGKGRNQLTEEERDYAENVYGLKKDGEDSAADSDMGGEDLVKEMGFLLRSTENQVTIEELDDQARARADSEEVGEGWRTTSGEESDTSDGDADSDDELEMDIALGEADAAFV